MQRDTNTSVLLVPAGSNPAATRDPRWVPGGEPRHLLGSGWSLEGVPSPACEPWAALVEDQGVFWQCRLTALVFRKSGEDRHRAGSLLRLMSRLPALCLGLNRSEGLLQYKYQPDPSLE